MMQSRLCSQSQKSPRNPSFGLRKRVSTTALKSQKIAILANQSRGFGGLLLAVDVVSNFSIPVAYSQVTAGAFCIGHRHATRACGPTTCADAALDM